MGAPPTPAKPEAAPPPPDQAKARIAEIDRQRTERKLRKSQGSERGFLGSLMPDRPETARVPGLKTTLG